MTVPRIVTGAVASGSCLYLATIGTDKDGRTRLIKSRSGEVRLFDREQISLKTFASFLLDFLEQRTIEQVVLVSSPESGTHKAMASTYKIETVLQMMPVRVALLSAFSLANRRLPSGAHFPGADRERLSASDAKLQSRAISVAVHWLAEQAEAPFKALEAQRLQDKSLRAELRRQSAAAAEEAATLATKKARVSELRINARVSGSGEHRTIADSDRRSTGSEDRPSRELTHSERMAALIASI